MDTLIPTAPWLISPVSDSGTCCKKCQRWLSATENKKLRSAGNAIDCPCGAALSSAFQDATLGIRGDSAQFLDEAIVRSTTWYHATTSEGWSEFVRGGEHMVHLGTREAALDRVRAFGDEDDPIFLYEVTLDAQSPVAADIFSDDDHWPSSPQYCTEDYDVWSVFIDGINRYVNACEAPGSISLLASSAYVRVLDRIEIAKSAQE